MNWNLETELSPAAQAVFKAATNDLYGRPTTYFMYRIACAIRAAAYQVAPARPILDSCCDHYEQSIRHKLLAIADELESLTPPDVWSKTCDKTSTLTDE
jgi:hypothetical protein